MERLVYNKNKEIWFEQLEQPYHFHAPFYGIAYVCILFNNDPFITNHDQQTISEQLVQSGCRYAVCAGKDCSTWDDSIDYAYLATDKDYNPSPETLVMTTWHDQETPEEVIDFGLHQTNFKADIAEKYLILSIGIDEDLKNTALSVIQQQE